MNEQNRAEAGKTREIYSRSRRMTTARKTGATAAKRTTPPKSNRVETGKAQEGIKKHSHHGTQQRTKPRRSWIYLTPISPAVKSRVRVSPARRDMNGQNRQDTWHTESLLSTPEFWRSIEDSGGNHRGKMRKTAKIVKHKSPSKNSN